MIRLRIDDVAADVAADGRADGPYGLLLSLWLCRSLPLIRPLDRGNHHVLSRPASELSTHVAADVRADGPDGLLLFVVALMPNSSAMMPKFGLLLCLCSILFGPCAHLR